MKPLDRGQEREVAFVRTQRTAWVNLPPVKRWLGAVAVIMPMSLLAAGLAALAHGPWVLVGLGMAGLMLILVIPQVLMPERMLRASARMMMPSEEAMQRGEAAWQRSGQANVPPRNHKPGKE